MTDLMRPALYQAQHRIIKEHNTEDKICRMILLVQFVNLVMCFEEDYPMEKLTRGDELIIKSIWGVW